MWKQTIKPLLAEIITSKKAYAAIAAIVVWSLAKAGVAMSPDAVMPVVQILMAYIVGQGLADIGKEKVKAEVKAIANAKALAVPDPN